MEVGQGPNWGCSAKGKKLTHFDGTGLNIMLLGVNPTADLRTSNNLKLEQKIRGKSGFDTRESNKESRGCHTL
jgi:hypothetical protein